MVDMSYNLETLTGKHGGLLEVVEAIVSEFVRRGKYMMRKCLLCGELFPSADSGERHCKKCQPTRHHLVKEEGRSVFL